MDAAQILYMAEVPESTQVYLSKPAFGVPPAKVSRLDVSRLDPKSWTLFNP